MIEKDDWRLLNDVAYLRKAYLNPTDGEEICKHTPHLKRCEFCFEPIQDNMHQWWFVPEDLACCIYEDYAYECSKCHSSDKNWKN